MKLCNIYVDSNSCSLVASDIAANQPLKAFRFAIKYGDADLRNHCAPLTVDHYSVEKMRTELKGLERYFPALVAWVCIRHVFAVSCSHNLFSSVSRRPSVLKKKRYR